MTKELFLYCFYLACSLNYLIENTNEEKTVGPLFDLPMELHTPNIVFIPELEPGAHPSFWELCDSLLNDIYLQTSLVQRLIPDQVKNFQVSDFKELFES